MMRLGAFHRFFATKWTDKPVDKIRTIPALGISSIAFFFI
jgi:hypothetical protein